MNVGESRGRSRSLRGSGRGRGLVTAMLSVCEGYCGLLYRPPSYVSRVGDDAEIMAEGRRYDSENHLRYKHSIILSQ